MKTFEVNSSLLETQFYQLPHKLYAGNKNWFAPLGSDLDQVFNPAKNSLFKYGGLKRWIALDKWNNISGRVAAFYSENDGLAKGGFGFFESSDDYEVAESLLDTAISWLRSKRCNQIEGPVNFGEKDRFWGLLSFGFDSPSIYLENYNPPYFETYFRQFGLQEKDLVYTFKIQLDQIFIPRLRSISDRLRSEHDIEIAPFSFSNSDKLINDIYALYSTSFKETNRLKLITPDDIHHLVNLAKPVLKEEYIWLAYHNHEPVGFLALIKDLNQILQNNTDEITLKGFGIAVKPGYREMGVAQGLSYALCESLSLQHKPCTFYFAGINSKTEAMISFMKSINATIVKQHKTFQLNFNH